MNKNWTMQIRLCAAVILTVACSPTTAIVVRHAERPPGADPSLNQLGLQRAQALVSVAKDAGVNAIYASNLVRTQQTAQPLAEALGLEVQIFELQSDVQQYSADLARQILSKHRGEVVLIVNHSNTVPLILEALGATFVPTVSSAKYDDLFIVTIPRGSGSAKVIKAKYGEPVP